MEWAFLSAKPIINLHFLYNVARNLPYIPFQKSSFRVLNLKFAIHSNIPSVMSKRAFHLCVVQIASHPSADVHDVNAVSEPLLDSEYSLTEFRRQLSHRASNQEIAKATEDALEMCEAEYTTWAKTRLKGILEWLSGQERLPDVIAFPEASLPMALLPSIIEFVTQTGCAVFAGSHRYAGNSHSQYLSMGFDVVDLEPFESGKEAIAIPVFERKNGVVVCHLRGKKHLSPPEQPNVFEKPKGGLVFPIMDIETPSGELKVVPLVCSEALLREAIKHGEVDLVVIASYQSSSKLHFFDPIKHSYMYTSVPVMYANDGNPGHTEITTLWDERKKSWFAHTGPLKGRLPSGDAILILETYPGNLYVEVGGVAPTFPARLVKLASIVPSNTIHRDYHTALLLREIRAAFREADTATVQESRQKFIKRLKDCLENASSLADAKVSRILEKLRDGTPLQALLDIHCDDCIIKNGIPLEALEQKLCERVLQRLEGVRSAHEWGTHNRENPAFVYHFNLCNTLRLKAGDMHGGSHLVRLTRTEIGQRASGVYQHAIKSLNHSLGRLLEKFQATSSMLEATKGESLIPLITHNHSWTSAINPMSAKEPVIDNDYQPTGSLGLVGSLISCPILHPEEHHAIGKITLFANYRNAFLPSHLEQLAAESLVFTVDLLVIHSIGQGTLHGWHPGLDGWHSRSLLNSLCFRLSTLGNDYAITTNLSVTIWIFDRPGSRIYARGTAHFDYEYETERGLPMESFTGSVANCETERVIDDDPRISFHRNLKALRMEVKHVYAAPIFRTRQHGDRPIGCLSVYLFGGHNTGTTSHDRSVNKDDMIELSRIIGRVIDDFENIRTLCARATISHRLTKEAVILSDGFQILLKTVLEILHAETGSIFVVENGSLRAVASTGLTDERGQVVPLDQCVYDISGSCSSNVGLTQHVARNPKTIIRRNNISHTSANPETVRPSNRYREIFPLSEATYRRFLCCAVTDEDGTVLGVIRVLRRATDLPFIEADEKLIQTVCAEGRHVFAIHHSARTHPGTVLDPGVAAGRLQLPWSNLPVSESVKLSAARLLRPILPHENINECETRSIIQDVHCLFRNSNSGAVIARLGYVKLSPDGQKFITNQFLYSAHTAEQPVEESFPQVVDGKKSIAIHCVESMRANFYRRDCDLYVPFHGEHQSVEAGICIPFYLDHCRWGRDDSPQVAVLTVEFNHYKQLKWGQLDALLCAIVKLSRIGLAVNDHDCYNDLTRCGGFPSFVEYVKRKASALGIQCHAGLHLNGPPKAPAGNHVHTLRIGCQPIGWLSLAGDDIQCGVFATNLRKYWTVFLNLAMGNLRPWYVSDYLPEPDIANKGMQPIELGISWKVEDPPTEVSQF